MENTDAEPFLTQIHNSCETCQRLDTTNPVTCEAFPQGIPYLILLGVWDHTHPFDFNGVSDNFLMYVPKD